NIPGFTISVAKLDYAVKAKFSEKITTAYLLTFISVFFLTLAFVHLLLFLFYKKQQTNLYYTVFVLLMGILFFIPIFNGNTSDPDLSIKFDHSYLYLLVLFFYSMLVMEDYLFRRTIGRSLIFSTAITVAIALTLALLLGKEHFKYTFIISFIIGTIYSSFSIVIKAIIRKLNGAWIIGTGSLFFLIFLSINILFIMFHNGISYRFSFSGWGGILFLGTSLLSVMSIPISMSVYLAREFAQTNKHLEKELKQVEELSAKSIEQEKEKQKILETQKEVLEEQVKERTSEIVEQKKLIEEKNKDITDSINYAKRIQEAILPEQSLLATIFNDSFILFKPKDIVSGDFYWFAEHENKKIIAVADCTGHGVPGALMSMIGSNLLNKIILEDGLTQPDLILNKLNDEVRIALKQKESTSETRDGMDISLICINGNDLQYAGAHRPLFHISQNNLIEIKADKFPIGGIQQEEKRLFTNHVLTLQKNDALYLSSDGFADQFGGVNGKKLMTKTFKELLIRIQDQKMEDQKEYLNTTIENWRGSREQVDDILVIGIKI
ncbi:MAG: SpoIIE family protein phosphatase, partial [Bacteroidia bacterium]